MGVAKDGKHEERDAARSRSRDKAAKGRSAGFQGYVNYTPNERDKADFSSWDALDDVFEGALADVLEAGYKLTLSHQAEEGCFMATLARWDATAEDDGLIFTVRAGNPVVVARRGVWFVARRAAFNLLPFFHPRGVGDSW